MVYKSKYANETFRVGDTRDKRVFAWLPFRINNDIVWLETYEIKQFYEVREYVDIVAKKRYPVYEWVNISYRIIR